MIAEIWSVSLPAQRLRAGPDGHAQIGTEGHQGHALGGWGQVTVLLRLGRQAPVASLARHALKEAQLAEGLLVPADFPVLQVVGLARATDGLALAAVEVERLVERSVGDAVVVDLDVAVGREERLEEVGLLHWGDCSRRAMSPNKISHAAPFPQGAVQTLKKK
ncbi:hypothetical protein [Variovorax ginsengisoli]|uniref:Uncharacterized protein n=1 Tax=Variovorax ginsengisoli TaxID=363844 RepID=A0ABT8SD37_9BURK|nr:hypothetical protein [Variovorax ginsengisoli]MDN8617173.1 hypothetical protein [Variovorax ginsengisoli]MDO1536343.1 hypothetical protein [Variovorax ginsengisoli]